MDGKVLRWTYLKRGANYCMAKCIDGLEGGAN